MILTLLDYMGGKNNVDIGELDDIGAIYIEVITGDERALVIGKDYDISEYDSGFGRSMDFCDGGYCVYNSAYGLNHLESDWFKNREDSYSALHYEPGE